MNVLVSVLTGLSIAICIIVLCLIREVKRLSESLLETEKDYYALYVALSSLNNRIWALYDFIQKRYEMPAWKGKVVGMDELQKAFENEIKLSLNTKE